MWPFQNETIETFKFISTRQMLPQYLRDKFTSPAEVDLEFEEGVQSPLEKDDKSINTKVKHLIVTERERVFERKEKKKHSEELKTNRFDGRYSC